MILDDNDLRDLVREAGDAIEVPAEGPARILARCDEPVGRGRAGRGRAGRGRASAGNRRWPVTDWRWLTPAALVVALVVAVVGGAALLHGGSSTPSHSTLADLGPARVAGPAAAPALPPHDYSGSAPAPAPAPGLPLGAAPPSLPTRVIKTGAVSLVLPKGRLSPTVDQLTSLAAGLGGYVTSAKSAEGGDAPTGDLTLRVPVMQYETLLGRVRLIGKPTSITTSGQDVTAQFVDLDARIRSLQATREQFRQVLSKATQIGDILNVEGQLSGIQTQIEELQGQQRVLDDQTTFGTLAVHLTEVGTSADPVPVGPLKGPSGWTTAWRHARHSFAHGIQSVISASGGLAIFLLSVGLLALLARLAWVVFRRRLV
jgi:hypothetical protein